MKKEVQMFTIICDGCGKDVNEDSEFSAWTDLQPSKDKAEDEGWYCDEDAHYCSSCHELDDDDNLIVLVNKPIS